MIFFFIIILLIFIELLIYKLVKYLKNDFQWIVEKNDYFPNYTKHLIKKYNKEIFNKDLGWDNKKKDKKEFLSSIKKEFIYSFNKDGSRLTKNKFKQKKIAIFGDSYAMSRYANDEESLQYFLEKYTKSKIFNYGVGNYGLDQVYLKIKKKINKKMMNIVVIFVPETISRNQSYWKHFLEFGNILAFKPVFKLKKNKLILENKHVNKLSLNNIKQRIINLKKKDFFYENKFKKLSFAFPYSICFFKDFLFNLKIFFYLIKFKLTKKNFFYQKAYYQVIKRNLIEAQKFYLKKDFSDLTCNIILNINNFLKKKGKKIYFFVLPQLIDIKLFNESNNSYKFYKKLNTSTNVKIFDLTKKMTLIKNINDYYVEDLYGGHLNKKGNKFVSKIIFKEVKNNS